MLRIDPEMGGKSVAPESAVADRRHLAFPLMIWFEIT
jgi:hypothetical protein